ncbi:MAG: non-canonical purine NTP pyrophosphatase, RdgB/HAM1 family [Synergistaceae bacterium]|nr:non-canonical purine NTP pyrophosphatase, RdgB/HAM1 family [Synergistaceae bacterium]
MGRAGVRLVLASGNGNKHREFTGFFASIAPLAGGNLELVTADGPGEVEEIGSTYEENALIKAGAWANFTGLPAIADDSGLEVRSLGWGPGIHSARVARGSDLERASWLLGRLEGAPDRRACFVACLVIAFPTTPDGRRHGYFSSEGRCWGNIANSPSGSSGFGYDPVFIPDGLGVTFAELGPEEKSKISHRAIAMAGVAQMIKSVIKYITVCGI